MWTWILKMVVLIALTKMCLGAVEWAEMLAYSAIAKSADGETNEETPEPQDSQITGAANSSRVKVAAIVAYPIGLAIWILSATTLLVSVVTLAVAIRWLVFALVISPLAWLYFSIPYTTLRLGRVSMLCSKLAWRHGGIRAAGLLIAPGHVDRIIGRFLLVSSLVIPNCS